jgi:hypothetical protein
MSGKLFIATLLILCVYGCVAEKKPEKYPELRAFFEHYKASVLKPEAEQQRFFSETMWQVLKGSREFSAPSGDVSVQALNHFPDKLQVTESVEKIDKDKGCLILQGSNPQGVSMDYIISLTREHSRWVFADISVAVYGPEKKRWIFEPVCDPQLRLLKTYGH